MNANSIKYAALVLLGALLFPRLAAAEQCAVVKIEIDQKLTFERQAFDARMRITNNMAAFPIQNIGVTLSFTDGNGTAVIGTNNPNDMSAYFFYRLDRVYGVSGDLTGGSTIPPGGAAEIHWLIIPTSNAAPANPKGKVYFFGATLNFQSSGYNNGQPSSITVVPDWVTVKPQPKLNLDYFLPLQVLGDDPFTPQIEPSVPFTLGLRVANIGFGTAKNAAISSSQPRIIENRHGLLINFRIVSSAVNDNPASPTLLAELGDLGPKSNATVRWMMTSTLAGRFINMQLTLIHSDELGGRTTSLITKLKPHWLIRDVKVDLPGRDNIRDFLAGDAESGVGPYTVYESENIDTIVTDVSANSSFVSKGNDASGNPIFTLTRPSVDGMSFLKITDPTQGAMDITGALRDDGKVMDPANIWFSKEQDPETGTHWSYFVNVFDAGGGRGTITQSGNIVAYAVSVTPQVNNPNAPPAIEYIPPHTGVEGNPMGFLVVSSSPSGPPSVTLDPLPAGSTFTDLGDGKGRFIWSTSQGQAGTYVLKATATRGTTSTAQFVRIRLLSRAEALRNLAGGNASSGVTSLAYTNPSLFAPGQVDVASPKWDGIVSTTLPQLSVKNAPHDPLRTVGYEFEVYSDASFNTLVTTSVGSIDGSTPYTPVTEGTGGFTGYTLTTPLPDQHHYYWRARAVDADGGPYNAAGRWSYGQFFVSTQSFPPGYFITASPRLGATVSDLQPLLQVTNSRHPNEIPMSYVFTVYSDSAMTQVYDKSYPVSQLNGGLTSWKLAPTPLTDKATYYWNVTATDALGNSTTSNSAIFTVDLTQPTVLPPTIVTPKNGDALFNPAISVNINPPAGASQLGPLIYSVELDTVETFDSPQKQTKNLTGTGAVSWTPADLAELTRYYLRVRASNGTIDSPWASINFYEGRLNAMPNIPSLRNPGPTTWVRSTTPTLSLNDTTDIDSKNMVYDIEVYSSSDLAAGSRVAHVTGYQGLDWTVPVPTPIPPATSVVCTKTVTVDNVTSTYLVCIQDRTAYYWRARAVDPDYSDIYGNPTVTSDWALPQSFYVSVKNPNIAPAFTFTAPAFNLTVPSGSSPLFKWTNVDPDGPPAATLYYNDPNANGATKVLAAGFAANQPNVQASDSGSYAWETTTYAAGRYTFQAIVGTAPLALTKPVTGAITLHRFDSFVTYCREGTNAEAPIQATVQALLAYTGFTDCEQAYGALQSSTSLDLTSTAIQDLRPLAYFTWLTSLTLDNTLVVDLSPLTELAALTSFSAASDQVVKDISACPTTGILNAPLMGFCRTYLSATQSTDTATSGSKLFNVNLTLKGKQFAPTDPPVTASFSYSSGQSVDMTCDTNGSWPIYPCTTTATVGGGLNVTTGTSAPPLMTVAGGLFQVMSPLVTAQSEPILAVGSSFQTCPTFATNPNGFTTNWVVASLNTSLLSALQSSAPLGQGIFGNTNQVAAGQSLLVPTSTTGGNDTAIGKYTVTGAPIGFGVGQADAYSCDNTSGYLTFNGQALSTHSGIWNLADMSADPSITPQGVYVAQGTSLLALPQVTLAQDAASFNANLSGVWAAYYYQLASDGKLVGGKMAWTANAAHANSIVNDTTPWGTLQVDELSSPTNQGSTIAGHTVLMSVTSLNTPAPGNFSGTMCKEDVNTPGVCQTPYASQPFICVYYAPPGTQKAAVLCTGQNVFPVACSVCQNTDGSCCLDTSVPLSFIMTNAGLGLVTLSDQPLYSFGNQTDTTPFSHDFVLTNEGDATVTSLGPDTSASPNGIEETGVTNATTASSHFFYPTGSWPGGSGTATGGLPYCSSSLAAGDSCVVTVNFDSGAVIGTYGGTLVMDYNNGSVSGTVSTNLTGANGLRWIALVPTTDSNNTDGSASTCGQGDAVAYEVVASYIDHSTQDVTVVSSFASSATAYATIDDTGSALCSDTTSGTTTLTATSNGFSGNIDLIVTPVDSAVCSTPATSSDVPLALGSSTLGTISTVSTGVITLSATDSTTGFTVGLVVKAQQQSASQPRSAVGYVLSVNSSNKTVTVASAPGSSTPATPSNWAPTDLLYPAEDYIQSLVFDKAACTLYATISTTTDIQNPSPGRIAKINLGTFTEVAAINFQAGEYAPLTAIHDTLGGNIYYTAQRLSPAASLLVKVGLTNFTETASLAYDTDFGDFGVIDNTSTYIYLATAHNAGSPAPDAIVAVKLSTFTVDSGKGLTLDATAAATCGLPQAALTGFESGVFDNATGRAYFVTATVSPIVVKINTTTTPVTLEGCLALSHPPNNSTPTNVIPLSATLDPLSRYAYFAGHGPPAFIYKVDLLNFTEAGRISLSPSTSTVFFNAGLANTEGYAYFGQLGSPSVISALSLRQSNTTTNLALPSGIDDVQSMALDLPSGVGYTATSKSAPGQIAKFNLAPP